ncbi:MAG: ribonuclease III [Thermoguttaceae bacterium]|nr:ribonuclease III [Thermoguttaceae bacterium]
MKRPSASPDLAECERRLRYRFADRSFLKKALTHSSYSAAHIDSNERLEFLGDATLGLAVTNLLYRTFPTLNEGQLSSVKGSVVSRKTCARIAKRLELARFLFVGKGVESITDVILANATEAVVGAIFLDGGYEEARLFVEENFRDEIDAFFRTRPATDAPLDAASTSFADFDGNFKARLQTRLHRENPGVIATYVLLDEKGPPHRRCFKIATQIGDRVFQAAWGNSKKATEQRAAENALAELDGVAPPNPDGE